MVVFLLAVVVLVVVVVMLKCNPRNSVYSWKVAFRGLLFQVVIVVVLSSGCSSGGTGNVQKQSPK